LIITLVLLGYLLIRLLLHRPSWFRTCCYDAGDKLGFLIATIEYALESSEIGLEFAQYLDTLYEKGKTI
jgi:hypothetical protein